MNGFPAKSCLHILFYTTTFDIQQYLKVKKKVHASGRDGHRAVP